MQLTKAPFGLDEKAFRFGKLFFGGDRYLAIKNEGEHVEAVIVDLVEDNEVERRSTRKADGAIKYPTENVLALRGREEGANRGHFVQVFDLDARARVGEAIFDEEIIYWKWLGNRCLVVITTTGVYHWMVRGSVDDPETAPALVFRQEGLLADAETQIINYVVDDEESPTDILWCAIAGIYLDSKKVIQGALQLFSVEKQQCQFLESHAGCFGTLQLDDLTQDPVRVFSFIEKKNGENKVYVMDLYAQRGEGLPSPFKASRAFAYPSSFPYDFPISATLCPFHGVIYSVTKAGFVLVYDAKTAQLLVTQRISQDGLFLTQQNRRDGGVYVLNRKGLLLSVKVNDAKLVAHINAQAQSGAVPNGTAIANSLALRYGYSSAAQQLTTAFRQALQDQKVGYAAKIYASSKNVGSSSSLRNVTNMKAIEASKVPAGESSAGMQLFQRLLSSPGRLTPFESLSLIQPVVAKGRVELAKQWLAADKLGYSEPLGDLLLTLQPELGITVYRRIKAHQKVVETMMRKGLFAPMIAYIKKKSVTADYSALLRSLTVSDPDKAAEFAKALLSNTPPLMDVDACVDIFTSQGKLAEIVAILVDALKDNRPEQAALQTRLFEISIASNPQQAEALFQQKLFTHFEKAKVAALCERFGLYKRALEFFEAPSDIKRVMLKAGTQLNQEWMSAFCASQPAETLIDIFGDMLRTNKGMLEMVTRMCTEFHAKLGVERCIKLLEDNAGGSGAGSAAADGLYQFLGSIAAFSSDPTVHYKCIQGAVERENWDECERIIRQVQHYDPVEVKEYLKGVHLADPRPLIYLCDIHGYVAELTEYLYRNNKFEFLEIYVVKLNQQAGGEVAVTLMDLGCPEDKILKLLLDVRAACDTRYLVSEMEKRGRLTFLLPWMKARADDGVTERDLHNALAKVYVETNENPEEFLNNNPHYDPFELGKFCQDKDPHLAAAAFMRGQCDAQVVEVARRNGLYRLLARYLIERSDDNAWRTALTSGLGSGSSLEKTGSEEPSPRDREFTASEGGDNVARQLADQVIATALTEAKSMKEITCMLRAFSEANLKNFLIEILDHILLHSPLEPALQEEANQSRQLRTLLLYSAIEIRSKNVKDYIERLKDINYREAADIALSLQLLDEAFLLFCKDGAHTDALNVLIVHKKDLKAAEEYVESLNDAHLFAFLANARLEEAARCFESESSSGSSDASTAVATEKSLLKAMDLYVRAGQCTELNLLVSIAKKIQAYKALTKFLQSIRQCPSVSEVNTDTELAYAFAKTKQLPELETFLAGVNMCNCQRAGDLLFEEGVAATTTTTPVETAGMELDAKSVDTSDDERVRAFRAAKLFYEKVPNYSKVAACNLRLGDCGAALEAAKKAGNSKSWTEICFAAIAKKDFAVARDAGLQIINYSDLIERVVEAYESAGHHEQLISLLEAGLKGTKTNISVFTELGIAYAKHQPEKLNNFLTSDAVASAGRLNVPKLIKTCEAQQLYQAVVTLYLSYGEVDQAVLTSIRRHTQAWSHEKLLQAIKKVTNRDVLYKTVSFYVQFHPALLLSLLTTLGPLLDFHKLITLLRTHPRAASDAPVSATPVVLAIPFLQAEQARANATTTVVNEVLNQYYLEMYDFEALHKSVLTYTNFDQSKFAAIAEESDVSHSRRPELSRKIPTNYESLALTKQIRAFGMNCFSAAIGTEQDCFVALRAK